MKEEIFNQEYKKLNEKSKQLIKKYDNKIYENKISDQKEELLHTIIKNLKNQKSSLVKYFQKELFIYKYYYFSYYKDLFYPEIIIKKNICYDYLSWYIWREKQVTRNYLLRAKYCWIIWNLNKSNIKYGQKFIRYCKYIVIIYIHNNWISTQHFTTNHFIINCIKSLLECVHFLKDRKNNEKIIDFSIKIIKSISNNEKYSIIITNISELILKDLKYYSQKYTIELISYLNFLFKKYKSIDRYNSVEEVYELLIELLKSHPVKVKLLKRRMARFYIKKGSQMSGIQSYLSYQKAGQIFKEIRNHKKLEKILKLIEKINLNNFMIPLTFTFDLSQIKEYINKRIKVFLNQNKNIDNIFEFIEIPLIEFILKFANSNLSQNNITEIFTPIIVSSSSITRVKKEDIEKGKIKIYNFYNIYINTYLICKIDFYKTLIKEGILTLDNLEKFFIKNNIDNNISFFLLMGFRFFMLNEYYASLFIFIPQIEELIRSIARMSGIPIVKQVKEDSQEKTIGEFLLDEDFEKVIGKDLNNYLFWFLADKTGLNLRNRVAHGFIKREEIQIYLIIGIIEIIFILIKKLQEI
ncbi:MAG: DUF4209 domain-containing protein [Promethearchaeota archaeon]